MKAKGLWLFSLLVFCCVSVSASPPTTLGYSKQELINYYDSGQYFKEFDQVIHQARNFLKQRVESNRNCSKPKKLAIVLDIDETSISNYPYLKRFDFGVNYTNFDKIIYSAKSPAIKSTLSLYNDALSNDVAVFFVTGRIPKQQYSTMKNLRYSGYKSWNGIYFKPSNYQGSSVTNYKATVRKLIEDKGYTIVASIGDQSSDIDGGHTLKGFKLPNPFYLIR